MVVTLRRRDRGDFVGSIVAQDVLSQPSFNPFLKIFSLSVAARQKPTTQFDYIATNAERCQVTIDRTKTIRIVI